MSEHLSAETAARLRRRMLPAGEIEAAVQHVAACPQCRAAVRGAEELAQVREAFTEDPPRHLTFDELSAIVDGGRPAGEQHEHLHECEICRAELDDLRPLAQRPRRRNLWWLAAAAAAVLIAIIAAALVLRREPAPEEPPPIVETTPRPEPRPPQPERAIRAEWRKLVDDALASGRLSFPAFVADLRASSQTLRGEGPPGAKPLEPSGVAVETTRPLLTWPPVEDAVYAVSIFDGETMVAQSEALRARSWTPPRPLRRGRTYTWQVEATRGGQTIVLPAPPDPPARFHVVGAAEHEELEAARAEHPDDHLLLAVLHARAGLEREAREHLGRAASNDPRVRRLQESSR